jgi:anti-sigma factor RsiW
MNDQVYNHLLELSWQRKLSPEEEGQLQAWLEAHPQIRKDWELEAALTEALGRMPRPLVSSNFTARVLQAVERDKARETRRRSRSKVQWLLRLAPRFGLASIVAAGGFILSHEIRQRIHQAEMRQELRHSIAKIAEVKSLPSPEVLENFEAIRLSTEPAADEKLLSLLQ